MQLGAHSEMLCTCSTVRSGGAPIGDGSPGKRARATSCRSSMKGQPCGSGTCTHDRDGGLTGGKKHEYALLAAAKWPMLARYKCTNRQWEPRRSCRRDSSSTIAASATLSAALVASAPSAGMRDVGVSVMCKKSGPPRHSVEMDISSTDGKMSRLVRSVGRRGCQSCEMVWRSPRGSGIGAPGFATISKRVGRRYATSCDAGTCSLSSSSMYACLNSGQSSTIVSYSPPSPQMLQPNLALSARRCGCSAAMRRPRCLCGSSPSAATLTMIASTPLSIMPLSSSSCGRCHM
mmetsp:Transcript_40987/g.122384  ORF Transcript_40987/g.122384 Transcript_40987/m.122384 type:complete len:290 (+) Transcript_40987:674-1543(+)